MGAIAVAWLGHGAASPATAASDRFASNTGSFQAGSAGEKEVLAVLRDKLEAGHASAKPDVIASALSAGFERRLSTSGGKMLIEPRAAFVEYLAKLGKSGGIAKLAYAVKGIKLNDSANSANVVALSTYQSRHFNPRFLETLVLAKEAGAWKVRRQVLLPLHPTKTELHKVEIYVTQPFWKGGKTGTFGEFFNRTAREIGPDAVIDMLREKAVAPGGWNSHVIAVFREPPKVGSEIGFTTTFDTGMSQYPFDTEFPVVGAASYFVAESIALGEDQAFEIHIEVRVDGERVARKSVSN